MSKSYNLCFQAPSYFIKANREIGNGAAASEFSVSEVSVRIANGKRWNASLAN